MSLPAANTTDNDDSGDLTSLDFTSFVPAPAEPPPAPPAAAAAPQPVPPPHTPPVIPPEAPPLEAGNIPAPAEEAASAAAPSAAMKSASLAGALNARVREPLAQILAATAKMPIRLDLGRIADTDDNGAQLLLQALTAARRAARPLHLAGAGHLAALLSARIASGQAAPASVWLLLAELQLWLGHEAEFEETAIGYAVAFEVSPPSWETPPTGQCEN